MKSEVMIISQAINFVQLKEREVDICNEPRH